MRNPVERYHEEVSKSRRANRLADIFASLTPQGATVLDVGTGDGLIAGLVQARRRDINIEGLEYQVREDCAIPVQAFDGFSIPREDASVDFVSFVDVLHHTEDVRILLKEAHRVARKGVVLKDHTVKGFAAWQTLKFMDWVGNRRFNVPLPFNYLKSKEWDAVFDEVGLAVVERHVYLELYPKWADWIFGRELHFFARLEKVI